jgi:hypothetical protein
MRVWQVLTCQRRSTSSPALDANGNVVLAGGRVLGTIIREQHNYPVASSTLAKAGHRRASGAIAARLNSTPPASPPRGDHRLVSH